MSGLVHLYCGDGKGKTTAAMGLALRALGAGLRVTIVQFLKDGQSAELAPLRALGAAVYLNWQFAGTGRLPVGDSSSETSQLGAAQLVNNTYVETVNDGAESGEDSGDALAQARIDRQNSRDQALELLDGVLEDVDSDSAAKQQAVEEASAIAQNILAESNVESLLEAKGYTDCVAYITAQECSVVLAGAVEEADTLIVQEVVMEQTGLTADKIKIIGTN